MEEFYIDQIFEGEYPFEAAIWCNENEATIEQIDENIFQIVAAPTIIISEKTYTPTNEELAAAIAELGVKVAALDN